MMSKPYTIKRGGNTVAYLKATEYFINADGSQRDASHWQGAGAEALGLAGKPVDVRAFERGLEGFAPNGDKLTKNAGSEKREKLGFDCVNSPPKSVSLAMAYASPELREAIIKASERANAESIKYLQDNLTIRTGKGGSHLEPVAGLAVATFTHMSSRALQMQMHHHNAIMGMAQRQDGTWGGFDRAELLAHYKTAGAIYQAELARDINEMGFAIIADEKNDFAFKVKGFSEEAEAEFSEGRKKILDYMKARNLDPKNRDACDRAAKAVRDKKDEPAFKDLLAVWKTCGEPFGLNAEKIESLREGVKQTPTIDAKEILAKLTEQQSVFERKDLLQAVAIAAGRSGGMTRAEIDKATDDILTGAAFSLGEHVKKSDRITSELRSAEPVKLGTYHPEQANTARPPQKLKTRQLYSTPEAIREELGLMQDFRAASEDRTHDRTAEQIAEARAKYEAEMSAKIGKPVSMKAEQVAALEHVATAGRHVLINGLSGTGKSFTMGAVRAMEEAAGQRVIGVALAGVAAAGLKDGASIAEGGTLAKLLSDAKRGKITLDSKTTIILDEAAMVGARQFRQLQKLAPEAKIVILGDRLQYQNIERGAWMGGLQDLGFKFAELNDIERQKIQWHRDAVLNLKDGRGAQALEAFMENGQMIFEDSTDSALKRMALDIANDATGWNEKIGIVPTHEKAAIVNDEVRRLRIERGELSEEAHWVEFRPSADGPKFLRELREGERLQFKKTNATIGVNNGEEATLTGISRHRNTGDTVLTLQRDDGKTFSLALSEYDAFTYAYAGTGNSKQGASKHHAYTFLDPDSLNKQAAYVIASRSKQETWLYGTTADCEDTADALANLGRAMSRDGSKDWTLDYLTPQQREEFARKLEPRAPTTSAPVVKSASVAQQPPASAAMPPALAAPIPAPVRAPVLGPRM